MVDHPRPVSSLMRKGSSGHIAILRRGVVAWNQWRKENPQISPDLRGAELGEAVLKAGDFSRTNLYRASLWRADLSHADLSEADLSSVTLNGAILNGANLYKANLRFARLVGVEIADANLSGCHVYGASVWNLKGDPKEQLNLVITPPSEPAITVDNIEVAQFIFLLLNNQKMRQVIDTITSKVVLILGRFTSQRKAVLDAIRGELRKRDYLPVLFDFEKPASQTTVETVSTLAHMARFVIADLTDAKSVLQELQAIVPLSPCVAVQPLLLASQEEPGMLDFIHKFPWVLETHRYTDQRALLADLGGQVIAPAEAKAKRQTGTPR
jgi:uncharacterized protein YjbI with pentapeptide repeats